MKGLVRSYVTTTHSNWKPLNYLTRSESERLPSSWEFHITHSPTGDPYASIKAIHTSSAAAINVNPQTRKSSG